MILTGYIDIPNALEVFKKVKRVLNDKEEEEEKASSVTMIC